MKTIEQQLSNKCVHFNGVMNPCCKAGVKYSEVRAGPMQFPCLNTGGECDKRQFRTQEDVDKELKEMEEHSLKTIVAYAKIKEHLKTNEKQGSLPCECGGVLKYAVAASNGHIIAFCKSCGINFRE